MTCSVGICDGPANAAYGMCHAHYRRFRLGKPVDVVITRAVPRGGQCQLSDCDKDAWTGGLCSTHYNRRREGEADWDRPIHDYIRTDDLGERLRHYCPEGAPDECWEWTQAINKNQGMIAVVGSKLRGAHIVAWEIANGTTVPPGLVVRHRCDNGICTNPAHLEVGTHADNVQDKVDRGRQLQGEDVPTSKLTEEEVLEICRLYDAGESQYELAAKFNTTQANVSFIVRGETWAHLTGRKPGKDGRIKLSLAVADEIRRLHAGGAWTHKRLAKRFDVSAASVSNIISGKSWSDLG